MPRRSAPDAIAEAVGRRIRALRIEAGLTLEKLAYESELGSKGHLSDMEHGLTRPNIRSLKVLADHLQLDLLDLVTFPEAGARQELVDLTRRLPDETLLPLLEQVRRVLGPSDPQPRGKAKATRESSQAKSPGRVRTGTSKRPKA